MATQITRDKLNLPEIQSFFPPDKKGYILRTALDLLVEKWPNDFTIAAIARHGGLSKPLVHYHFKTTREVIGQIMHAWAKSGQLVTTSVLSEKMGHPPQDLLLSLVDATFVWLEVYPKFARLTPILIHFAQIYPEIGELQQQVMSVGQRRIETILVNGRQTTKSAPAKYQAKAIHSQIIGGFLYQLATQGEKVNREVIQQTKQSICFLL